MKVKQWVSLEDQEVEIEVSVEDLVEAISGDLDLTRSAVSRAYKVFATIDPSTLSAVTRISVANGLREQAARYEPALEEPCPQFDDVMNMNTSRPCCHGQEGRSQCERCTLKRGLFNKLPGEG